MLPIPPEFIELINDIAYKFLWNNKPEKIRRKTIIADYENGGLKMLDINSFLKAQKATWVKRLLSPDNASWKALPKLFLDDLLGLDTFKCNMTCTEKPKDFPGFYWQIIKNWNEIKNILTHDEPKTPFEIRRETLWLNKNIKTKGKEIRWDRWHKKGINIMI